MVRDFPLNYLQIFLITHEFAFFLLSELALVCVQNFNFSIFLTFYITGKERASKLKLQANFIFQIFQELYF